LVWLIALARVTTDNIINLKSACILEIVCSLLNTAKDRWTLRRRNLMIMYVFFDLSNNDKCLYIGAIYSY
jgi:hypothetical protein